MVTVSPFKRRVEWDKSTTIFCQFEHSSYERFRKRAAERTRHNNRPAGQFSDRCWRE